MGSDRNKQPWWRSQFDLDFGDHKDKWDFEKPEAWWYLAKGVFFLVTLWTMGWLHSRFSEDIGNLWSWVEGLITLIGFLAAGLLMILGLFWTAGAALAIVVSFIAAVRSARPGDGER